MKSPITGKEMKRVYEKRTWNFRGEQFEYLHAAWILVNSSLMMRVIPQGSFR